MLSADAPEIQYFHSVTIYCLLPSAVPCTSISVCSLSAWTFCSTLENCEEIRNGGEIIGWQKRLLVLRKAIKKTWKVWWNEKRRGELHYIVITCTHTHSLVQSKRDFSRDKLSPAGFILCAWSVSVCTNRGEGRCKVESADRKLKHCESSCYYVLGTDLWSGCLQCAPWKHLWSPNISSVREAWECQATLLASSP